MIRISEDSHSEAAQAPIYRQKHRFIAQQRDVRSDRVGMVSGGGGGSGLLTQSGLFSAIT